MSSVNCFDLSQVHTVQALSGSNFFRLTERASYILRPVSQWKSRAEQFAAKWFVLSGLAIVWSTRFGQRLLAWLTSEPTCTNFFCPNWSRLP